MPLTRRSQLEMALVHGIVTMALELGDGDGCPHGSSEASDLVLCLLSQAGYRIDYVRGRRDGVDHCWLELAYPDRPFEYIVDLSATDSAGPAVLSKVSPEAGIYRGCSSV
jgi:hypothetical protein